MPQNYYSPKFKSLSRFRQAILPEKTYKIEKFNRAKWKLIKKAYIKKKKYKYKPQDAKYHFVNRFHKSRNIRIKKTYKFMLRAKERLQLYYYGKRARFYPMKRAAQTSLRVAKNNGISGSKVFFNTFEQQLHTFFYRAGFVSSTLLAKKFLNQGFIKINKSQFRNCEPFCKKADFLQIDPIYFNQKLNHYLKSNFPYFHSSRMRYRRAILKKRFRFFSYLFSTKYGHKQIKFCNRLKFLMKLLLVKQLKYSARAKNV